MGEPRGHENLMARELNGRLRQDALVAQEDKEALQSAAAGHDGPWCSPLLAGGSDPGIKIRRRGLGQILIEGGLTGLGHQHRKTFEGTERTVLCRRRIVAGAQISQIVRNQALVVGTEKMQPTELWECVERMGGL